MANIRMRDSYQQECVRILKGISGRYSTWDLWNDFIVMSACSLQNVFPNPMSEEREAMYAELQKKHSPEEIEGFSKMLALAIESLSIDPQQDFLGELFMGLGLGSKWHGQFFTPYHICDFMSKVVTSVDVKAEIEEKGFIGVSDPCCGAGALLIAFANQCQSEGVNYQTSVLFSAQDIDQLAGLMCYIQLSLLGCAGYVKIGDSLSQPTTCIDRRGLIPSSGQNIWYTPMYYRDIWQMRVLCENLALMTSVPRSDVEPQEEATAMPEPEPEIVTVEEYSEDKSGQLMLF